MHNKLHKELSIQTALLQFYCFLTRGFFDKKIVREYFEYGNENIEKIHNMTDPIKWDGRYDVIIERISETKKIVQTAKSFFKHKQHSSDEKIAEFMHNHSSFYEDGIMLNDLKDILEIDNILENGYMLHDHFMGYPEKELFQYRIDCIDFLYSSSYFYNEGLDLLNNRKSILTYSEINLKDIPPEEVKRIQTKEEAMYRNFREAFINLIFFVESFINSVGFDAFLNGIGKDIKEARKLKGIKSINSKNGFTSYLSLKEKIAEYSKIISGKKLDTEIQPFKDYIDECVSIRNKYVHSSPEKGNLKISLDEWKLKCDNMIDNIVFDVINSFWKGCYPKKRFPAVIFNAFSGNSFKGRSGKYMITK
jgi:hypothetical protein